MASAQKGTGASSRSAVLPASSGEPAKTKSCKWDGTDTDATVTYRWDPTAAVKGKVTPWQPLPRVAITEKSKACVPVSLSFDVFDAAGYRVHGPDGAKRIEKCRSATDKPGKVVNLQPPKPPAAPGNLRLRETDFRCPPSGDFIRCVTSYRLTWGDVENEEGYRVYVENFEEKRLDWECPPTIKRTSMKRRLLDEVPANVTRFDGAFTPEMTRNGVIPGSYYYVVAFNGAGESRPTRVQGYFLDTQWGDCIDLGT